MRPGEFSLEDKAVKLDREAIYLTYVREPGPGVVERFKEVWGGQRCHEEELMILNPQRTVGLIKNTMRLEELMSRTTWRVAYYLGRWSFNLRKGRKSHALEIIVDRQLFKYRVELLKPSLKVLGREVDVYILSTGEASDGVLLLANGRGAIVIAPTFERRSGYDLEDLAVMLKAPDGGLKEDHEEKHQADKETPKWLEEAIERWAKELGVI